MAQVPSRRPTHGELREAIRWAAPPPLTAGEPLSASTTRESRDLLVLAAECFTYALDRMAALERMVPPGFEHTRSHVDVEPGVLVVVVEFVEREAGEQSSLSERAEVHVDHPSSSEAVVVPIERPPVPDVGQVTTTGPRPELVLAADLPTFVPVGRKYDPEDPFDYPEDGVHALVEAVQRDPFAHRKLEGDPPEARP